ncbi:MAG: DUF456 family protein [Bacteroidales bacterium]|nr:DUF456 family protein [Bacteroidales bacterium]MDD6141860.1 DUF456 family protein [Bacteroidales bacterium]MDD6622122.1 DUF456 family protein [Bacteroidales bacterium]MDD6669933.1 DUF456 family protein [Bacteroidales bacterium]
MEIVALILVILLYCFGFLSCFINKVPGPLLVAIATVLAKCCIDSVTGGWLQVVIVCVLAIAAMIASKMITKVAKAKLHPYSKGASFATTIASILALLILVGVKDSSAGTVVAVFLIGFIVLPFVFAYLVEIIKQKNNGLALKSAGSATAVYLSDTMLKLFILGLSFYLMFA